MQKVPNPLGAQFAGLEIPDNAFIATMSEAVTLENPAKAIAEALENPLGSESLSAIAKAKKAAKKDATAVIVLSDNTRPVPYKGEEGILLPIIKTIIAEGFKPEEITVLIGTGMHRPMTDAELRDMIDPEVYNLGIAVINHEPKNEARLTFVGTTARGTKALIDTIYTEADLKIVTGLVESHFMAGASGGRKGICPAIIGEDTTYIFHGPELMGDDNSRDLNIEGNPVHEESLAVARLAGCDFIVNVTLDSNFKTTGVFAGDLEVAHLAAVDKIKEHVEVPCPEEADVVITHAGFVGINHYQIAKSAVACLNVLKKDGYLVTIGNCTDSGHKIGSPNYRTTLALLKLIGSEKFVKLLKSPDWVFLPEQWQVQMWARTFKRIPQEHYYLYAPQLAHAEYHILPGNDIRTLFEEGTDESDPAIYDYAVKKALEDISAKTGKKIEDLKVIYIAQGPYEIPVVK